LAPPVIRATLFSSNIRYSLFEIFSRFLLKYEHYIFLAMVSKSLYNLVLAGIISQY
jgi:hypothetical protein